jgi:hypothetical protein
MSFFLSHLISHRAHKTGLFDLSEGFRLLRDRGVPIHTKLLALALGVLLTLVLELLQVPLEMVVGFFLPFIGVGLDFAFDGVEFVLLPLLFASFLMPRLHRVPATQPARR